MENRFNNKDFEQFVKQNADQYRMFPSEKVWDNIHNTLHVRRRWYGIGIALLLITVTAVTLVMVNQPDKNQPVAQLAIPSPVNKIAEAKSKTEKVFIAPATTNNNNSTVILSTGKLPAAIFHPAEFANQPDVIIAEPTTVLANNATEVVLPVVSQTNPVITSPRLSTNDFVYTAATKPNTTPFTATKTAMPFAATVTDNSIESDSPEQKGQFAAINTNADLLTIESVVNSYKRNKKSKKISIQAYVTPTISYRSLKENKAFLRSAQSGTIPLSNIFVPDVKNIVTHKPDMGFQLGFSAGYPLSKNIILTGGLQFTVSKYDIKAYISQGEQATIALSNSGGGTNTVSAYSSYRNYGGYKANWLRNLYISASAPVGLEIKLAKSKKGYVGIGGTIQPTYVIDNSSYLLSTDYKNYAEIPELIRRWNINGGFEVFAASTFGKVKWRIGPQVRYQTMSSFKEKYPVKEHLFDFGLKLGVMLQ